MSAIVNENNRPSTFRYVAIVSASILIMLCSGAVYAWSIFVAPLQAEFGFSTTQTQLVYGLIIALFTIGMLFVNKVLRRYGPRITAAIGAIFFFTGYMVASFSNGNLLLLITGMSLLSGIGMAFGYVTVLNNLVKWFPHNKGLATGMAVSGFGGGAILLSQIARPLIANGWHVMDIFRTVGIVYGVLFLTGALILTVPSWYQPNPAESKVDLKKMLTDKRFWTLFYVFFAGTFAGLLFNGNLKPIGQSSGVSAYAAVLAISLFSIGNAAGRILWGQVHDMIGGKMAVMLSLSLLTGCMLLLLVGSGSDVLFMLMTLLLGLSFGANFVTYASDVADYWGIARLDIVYPAVSVAYGIAGILGPMAGGFIRDTTGAYQTAIILGAVICATGIAVYGLKMPRTQKAGLKTAQEESTELASSKRTG